MQLRQERHILSWRILSSPVNVTFCPYKVPGMVIGNITFLVPTIAPRETFAPPMVSISMTVLSDWRYGRNPLPLIHR